MTPSQPAPKFELHNTSEYRESYANSVQIRVNLWDFFLMFGTVNQTAPDAVTINNFQGVYLSPQQAKALLNVLTFLSELSASVSFATPRQTISLSELSTRSTVRVASFS